MKCPFCFGRGEEIVSDFLYGDQVTPCPDCNGTGEVANQEEDEAEADVERRG